MKLDILANTTFSIQFVKAQHDVPLHRELMFKLVFIMDGTGIHHVHRTHFPYHKGDIFIVAPGEETHCLKTIIPTQFLLVRFTFGLSTIRKSDNPGIQNLLQSLQYANNNPDYIVNLRKKQVLVNQLVNVLVSEINNEHPYVKEYIHHLFYTLLLLIAEAIKMSVESDLNLLSDKKTAEILHYIHQNICSPGKLTTHELSRRFCLSPVYIGRYFKSNTNQNLHQYIMSYKIKLIENRLENSDMRIGEIADEFGFADKSYLNKFFVKLKGTTPSAYRNCKRIGQSKSEYLA